MEPTDKKKEEIKEPYSPTDTPNPPQDINPSHTPEKDKNDISDGQKKRKKDAKISSSNSQKKSQTKQLGESETEIDETTV